MKVEKDGWDECTGSGHIMNISSANGLFPLPYTSPYASTKFALRALSEILQYEVAQYGVGVTTVHPGMIKDTHLLDHGRPDNEDGPKIQRIADRVGYDLEKAGKAMVKAVRANKARLRCPGRVREYINGCMRAFPIYGAG